MIIGRKNFKAYLLVKRLLYNSDGTNISRRSPKILKGSSIVFQFRGKSTITKKTIENEVIAGEDKRM